MLDTLKDLKDFWVSHRTYVPADAAEEALYIEKLTRLNRFMDRVLIALAAVLLLVWGGAVHVFF